MSELVWRLAKAEIASCSCLTMSADPAMHKDDCKYKLFADAGNALRELTAKLEAAEKENYLLQQVETNLTELHNSALATITYQAAQIEALEKDAARHRWLADYLVSDRTDCDDAIIACADKSEIDAVIDAAILGENNVR